MPQEHELRFLRNLPDPHAVITPATRDCTVTIQAVHSHHGVLVAKPENVLMKMMRAMMMTTEMVMMATMMTAVMMTTAMTTMMMVITTDLNVPTLQRTILLFSKLIIGLN